MAHQGKTIRHTTCLRPHHYGLLRLLMDKHNISMAKAIYLALEVGLKTILMQPIENDRFSEGRRECGRKLWENGKRKKPVKVDDKKEIELDVK